MRDILFRAKTLSGKWVEGAYYKQELFYGDKEDAHIIITSKETLDNDFALERYIVIPETIGQYTGLTDKNGKKIFEGDIVKHFDNSEKKKYDIGEIYYDTKLLMWRRTTQGSFHKSLINSYKLNSDCIYEVIGNIHDNPELRKGGDVK